MRSVTAAAFVATSAADIVDPRDLLRARTKVPRAQFQGEGHNGMTGVLNNHLHQMYPQVKACSEWSAEELQQLQSELFSRSIKEFDDMYAETSDSRRMRHASLEEHEAHWAEMNEHAKANPHMADMLRDGHCHQAVMWLVHHVPAPEQQTVFAKRPIPTLGAVQHKCPEDATAAEQTLCNHYEDTYSCAKCHSGVGMITQDWEDFDGYLPEDPKHPGWARQRRCDQNYLPACGPCEGIGGPYWSDSVNEFQPTNCEVIATPEEVPEKDRMYPSFPEQFIVHQIGSDRLSRVQNPGGKGRISFPPFYSQIRSTFWYDYPLGNESEGIAKDGMGKLRHDSYYDDRLYQIMDKGLVTEIHFETREQREQNVTGAMVSLLHGLLGWGKNFGGCTCVSDPVGMPVIGGILDNKLTGDRHSAFLVNSTYRGRVKIGVEYADFKFGDKKPNWFKAMKVKKDMVVDHYTKWFLHVFFDADPESPTYTQPVRFYGPYSGFAVYVKVEAKAPPAEVWDTACVDNGWGEKERKPLKHCMGKKLSEYKCMNVAKKNPAMCAPWEADAGAGEPVIIKGAFGSIVLPQAEQMTV
jgi:hypothetical protein